MNKGYLESIRLYSFVIWVYVIVYQFMFPIGITEGHPISQFIPIRIDIVGILAFISSFISDVIIRTKVNIKEKLNMNNLKNCLIVMMLLIASIGIANAALLVPGTTYRYCLGSGCSTDIMINTLVFSGIPNGAQYWIGTNLGWTYIGVKVSCTGTPVKSDGSTPTNTIVCHATEHWSGKIIGWNGVDYLVSWTDGSNWLNSYNSPSGILYTPIIPTPTPTPTSVVQPLPSGTIVCFTSEQLTCTVIGWNGVDLLLKRHDGGANFYANVIGLKVGICNPIVNPPTSGIAAFISMIWAFLRSIFPFLPANM